MRFYTKPHPFYCGLARHARTLSLCILHQAGDILGHRHRPAGPAPFLTVIAPYREALVVWVEGLFTWYWLAALGARAGLPCVRGHALYMKAIHGGKAKNATIDAQKIAVLFRGGMRPQAYVYPAAMRATRALLRRRLPLRRTRAALLAPIHTTTSQYNRPELGQKRASKANRAGVAERLPAPAVQKRLAVDLALIDHDDHLLRDVELASLHTAQPHEAHTRSRRRPVPGSGERLRRVLLDAIHALQRFPRGQAVVSSCRRVQGAQAAAGKRDGTSGTQIGHASRKWACSEAAVVFLRTQPPGQQSLVRLENKPGQGKALTGLAHTLARAVYDR
jgi:hypothetical protein